MVKRYSDQEKRDAVSLLYRIQREGSFETDDGVIIDNVRKLCLELNISSYSLYKWVKEFEVDVPKPKHTKKAKLSFDAEEREFFKSPVEIDIFGIRYYAWMARTLGIANYNSLPLKQLLLKIGLKMIKKSGLVQTVHG